jgi:hypothetical protein
MEQALDITLAETGSPAQTKCLAAAFFKIKPIICISAIATSRASLTSLNLEYCRKKDASTTFLQVHGHNIAAPRLDVAVVGGTGPELWSEEAPKRRLERLDMAPGWQLQAVQAAEAALSLASAAVAVALSVAVASSTMVAAAAVALASVVATVALSTAATLASSAAMAACRACSIATLALTMVVLALVLTSAALTLTMS